VGRCPSWGPSPRHSGKSRSWRSPAEPGKIALFSNTTSNSNTALGTLALFQNTTGSANIAIGAAAEFNVMMGSNNIHIGNEGVATDAGRIRIGTVGIQTATSIAGIFGAPSLGGGCRLR
jgi:hypothetical protein